MLKLFKIQKLIFFRRVCVSHTSMPKDAREKLKIFDSTIRLSVGLENIKDLINDLKQAFEKTFE